MTPTPNLNVVEWAERYRRLSKESSNGGRFIVWDWDCPGLVDTENAFA